ncbi:hypothetical protein [Companilactobacillus futsaii]|uniref:Uncharacterized protein n=2 Tax=Companilactobacillus futsaii TaxID=938155 RepID=A0A5B7SZN0_9LACO|nr:hypothetical protein [Companilactobacillus futsaii]KRK93062.1 hypothetical protein FC88_GL000532 [Companilactobacillus futsaii JCM 17355]QCX25276.1 hypothetical protein FG051_09310 [Companilactobacillus futsaii]
MLEGIIGGILGLIGVGISLYYSNKINKENQKFQKELEEKRSADEIWRRKYEVLVKLIGYRFDFSGKESLSAINSIAALFYDSDDVMNAVKDFYDYSTLPGVVKNTETSNDKLVTLYMAIYSDLGIDKNVDKSFLKRVFLYDSRQDKN